MAHAAATASVRSAVADWRDPWKLGVPGHDELRRLHEALRDEIRRRWDRSVPFADELLDRWERAAWLGFGEGSSIYDQSLVLGEVEVGEQTWIGPGTILDGRGGLSIGSYCSISAGVQIYSHDTLRWALSGGKAPEERARTVVEDRCYLGPQTVVAKGVTIGTCSAVGALSFVNRDVPPFSIAVGIPARVRGRVVISEDGAVELVWDDR